LVDVVVNADIVPKLMNVLGATVNHPEEVAATAMTLCNIAQDSDVNVRFSLKISLSVENI